MTDAECRMPNGNQRPRFCRQREQFHNGRDFAGERARRQCALFPARWPGGRLRPSDGKVAQPSAGMSFGPVRVVGKECKERQRRTADGDEKHNVFERILKMVHPSGVEPETC